MCNEYPATNRGHGSTLHRWRPRRRLPTHTLLVAISTTGCCTEDSACGETRPLCDTSCAPHPRESNHTMHTSDLWLWQYRALMSVPQHTSLRAIGVGVGTSIGCRAKDVSFPMTLPQSGVGYLYNPRERRGCRVPLIGVLSSHMLLYVVCLACIL